MSGNKNLSDIFGGYITQTYTSFSGQEQEEQVEQTEPGTHEDTPVFLPEDTLDALSALNAERAAMFNGIESPDAESVMAPQSLLDEAALVRYAQEHGVGQLIVMFHDAMKMLGYDPISVAHFVHNKSGVIVQI